MGIYTYEHPPCALYITRSVYFWLSGQDTTITQVSEFANIAKLGAQTKMSIKAAGTITLDTQLCILKDWKYVTYFATNAIHISHRARVAHAYGRIVTAKVRKVASVKGKPVSQRE